MRETEDEGNMLACLGSSTSAVLIELLVEIPELGKIEVTLRERSCRAAGSTKQCLLRQMKTRRGEPLLILKQTLSSYRLVKPAVRKQ